MPMPPKLATGFPDDWNEFLRYVLHQSDLTDQLAQRGFARSQQRGLEGFEVVSPQNDVEALISLLQQESIAQKEDIKLLINLARLQESNQQVLIAKMKSLLKRLERVEAKKKSK